MKLLIGQTGAPTAVVNRSLAGFLSATSGCEVLASRGGPDGLVEGSWVAVSGVSLDRMTPGRPGSWLGGGRRAVTGADVRSLVSRLADQGVDGLALIGGNGTMALLLAVWQESQRAGIPLRCVGIPKTIDNDLVGADPAPGYASAASYVARTVADMSRDHAAMASIEPVRIVETMGRGTGWLTLASTYPVDPGYEPHLVALPEQPWSEDGFLAAVERTIHDHSRALVVVSEGVAPELSQQPVHAANHSTLIHGGVARILAQLVTEHLGVNARGEVLGTAQRSAAWAVTPFDTEAATNCGRLAGEWLASQAHDAVMSSPHGAAVPLVDVAGRVRPVPDAYRSLDPAKLAGFHAWLRPLIQFSDNLEKEIS